MRHYSRLETSEVAQLNIFRLCRDGLFDGPDKHGRVTWERGGSMDFYTAFNHGSWEIRLEYSSRGRQYDCWLETATTHCNYGGLRYWFTCPECGKRAGILYFSGGLFNCRECSYLTYESRNIGGSQKDFGRIISDKEVEYFRKQAKRKYYNGKLTRKYARFLKKEWKARRAWRGGVLSSAGLI